ncbi:MAG: Gfo/Idh/MocA family oxidoreductase [Anaerolineae bacterium]|nr:Gfo/Idh/MocA family oxidoreductase [Anaerolineae bacterium]
MSDKIRWGILSTSNHAATSVIPAIRASADGEAAAVASRDGARAQLYAREHGILKSYGDYEALLADPDIDVIYNPLPNHLHKTWSIRAAQAGKHVLCEKPIALNAAEAEEMVRAFRDAGRKLAETFQWRHHPQAQRVRELVRQGTIGDVRLINASFSFPLDRPHDVRWEPKMGGGALYDVGCYPVSLVRYMLGQEPLTVTAHAHWGASGVDDLMVGALVFPAGVMASIDCSFVLTLRRLYEVVGTTGALVVNRDYSLKADTPGEIMHYGPDRKLLHTYRTAAVDSYQLMVQDFNRAVIENTDPVFLPEDAVANMRVLDALYKAAREGGTVSV